MNTNRQKPVVSNTEKGLTQQQAITQQDAPDERYPGTFFRVPGVPIPGKNTWSLVK